MPFPTKGLDVGLARPFRKVTLDVDGVETDLSSSAVFERRTMTSGRQKLLIAAPPSKLDLFRALANCLSDPLLLLYVLHTPRGEGAPGRYQSPPLDKATLDDVLASFETYLAGDARHDVWVYSANEGRTLVWDRHNLIHAEGEPLQDITAALEEMGFKSGIVPRPGTGPHVHYYRPEFDEDAAAFLARLNWVRSDLRPEDEQ